MHGISSIYKKKFKYPVELRKNKRVLLDEKISSFKVNEKKVEAPLQIVNISIAGIGFTTRELLNESDLLELYVKIPESITIAITAKVVWRGMLDDRLAYGCEIIAMGEMYRQILKDFIDRQTETENI